MSEPLLIILCIIGSYFIGNINNALLISKLKKKDVRQLGSGNPGTMNMIRNFGIFYGGLTLVLDVVKGVVPCIIGWYLLGNRCDFGTDKIGVYICGLSLVIGHIFPVFLKFKGGKGIAGTIGVCLVINPWVTAISFIAGVIFLAITKMGAATSFIIISIPLMYAAYYEAEAGNVACLILLFAIFLLPMLRHLENIKKLFSGTENKTSLIKHKKKDK